MIRLGILGSGRGTNCRALLEAIRNGALAADARVVISDVPEAPILAIAREFGVPDVYLSPGKFRTKLEPAAENDLIARLRAAEVELVVLAGFMRVLKHPTLEAFPRRIINIHPSLLPNFPGVRAWDQALAAGAAVTGCTVHFVDAGIDSGEIIAQKQVPVLPGDSAEILHARIQVAERALYPEVIARFSAGAIT